MLKCEYCGKEYDPEEAEEYFNDEMAILVYSNVRKRLCGECAVQAIYDDEEGVYIQKCEECGREFDYVVDKWEFENDPSTDGLSLIDCWEGVKCAQCAIEAHKKRLAEYDDYED